GPGECNWKGLTFRQKPIAGVNGLRTGRPACSNDLFNCQIGLGRRWRADWHRLIRHLDMQCVAVRLGIDRDSLNSHFASRPDDPAGDLAAVSNENLLEHRCPRPWASTPTRPAVETSSSPKPAGKLTRQT